MRANTALLVLWISTATVVKVCEGLVKRKNLARTRLAYTQVCIIGSCTHGTQSCSRCQIMHCAYDNFHFIFQPLSPCMAHVSTDIVYKLHCLLLYPAHAEDQAKNVMPDSYPGVFSSRILLDDAVVCLFPC